MSGIADICIISEGSYPYVKGGVASWIHDMVSEMKEYRFHVVSLVSPVQDLTPFYAIPSNVIKHDAYRLGALPDGRNTLAASEEIHARLRPLLMGLIDDLPFERDDFSTLLRVFATYRAHINSASLLNDKAAWETLLATYESGYAHVSFLDFFWSYRVMLSTLTSTLTFPLPVARMYHAVSTGYAGLLGARAKHETGAPLLISEHGIYTNERRIEILGAEWLQQHRESVLSVDRVGADLRALWVRYFEKMGHIAYEASDQITSLFSGSQMAQHADGASLGKTRVVPNGIDVERFASLPHQPHIHPTVALVGRVVPMKDVKTFIHAVAIAVQAIPQLQALIIGPTDEDPAYAETCQHLATAMGLDHVVKFMGMASVDQYYPVIDVVALTSISEVQPLVMLEAGAAGIPLIATDVGACRELVCGCEGEMPAFGDGGVITPLANPQATAEAIIELLTNRERYEAASRAIKTRIHALYQKRGQFDAYRNLYQSYLR